MVTSSMMSKDLLIEKVCERCPATGWGKKAHCQVHGSHVGTIHSCPEWDKFLLDHEGQEHAHGRKGSKAKSANSQLALDLDLVQRAEDEIRDYQYMQIEVSRIQRYLRDAGEGMVAQYGLEAAMPKGQGRNADRTQAEVARRERKWKRLQNLQEKIERINEAVETIADEQERLVLEALLDGDKNTMIAKEIGVSRQRYYEIKRSAISKMARSMYGA